MTKKQNIILLICGALLIGLGLFKPDILSVTPKNVNNIVVEQPSTPETKEACNKVIETLLSGPSPKQDGLDLASLYSDISRLIALDGKNEVIKSTADLSQVNKIAGSLLQLDLKNKYDNLASECQSVIVSVIGDENVPMDKELREKAVTAFKNLAWACKRGAE